MEIQESITYEKIYEYDQGRDVGYESKKQEGKNGLKLVKYNAIVGKDGVVISTEKLISERVVTPAQNEVFVRGLKKNYKDDIAVGVMFGLLILGGIYYGYRKT